MFLFRSKPNSNSTKNNLSLKLRKAASIGQVKEVEIILHENAKTKKFDINEPDENGNTILLCTTKNMLSSENKSHRTDFKKIILMLLEHGANDILVNQAGEFPYSILNKFMESNPNDSLLNFMHRMLITSLKKELGLSLNKYDISTTLVMVHFLRVVSCLPEENTLHILSLACSDLTEAVVIRKILAAYGKKIAYYGVNNNIDNKNLDVTQRICDTYKHEIFFVNEDPTNLAKLKETLKNCPFNFGFLRNGHFGNDNNPAHIMTKEIFPTFLSHKSIILVTLNESPEKFKDFCQTKLADFMFQPFSKNCLRFSIKSSTTTPNFYVSHKKETIIPSDTTSVILRFDKTSFDEKHNHQQSTIKLK